MKQFALMTGVILLCTCTQETPVAETSEQEQGAGNETSSSEQPETSPQKVSQQPKTLRVPVGTEIHIRLNQHVSSEQNRVGDSFQAHLDKPVEVDGKVVVPAASIVVGELTEVQESGRVKGRARLTMMLKTLMIDGKSYPLTTYPISIQAEGTMKEDATKIGIGAAVGAAIGAIVGGGDGAAKGAVIGGGAGTGVVLATKGDEVEFAPETQFAFTLSSPLEVTDSP